MDMDQVIKIMQMQFYNVQKHLVVLILHKEMSVFMKEVEVLVVLMVLHMEEVGVV